MRILFFIIFFKCFAFSNDIVDHIMERLDKNEIPKFEVIKINRNDDEIKFKFNSYKIKLKTFIFEPAIITVTKENLILLKSKTKYPIWGEYLDKVISFDLDKNGLKDLFIISTPVGASGDASNIVQITGILFFKNSHPKMYNFSSFFGGENLFGDFNKDNIYDFACIKLIREDTNRFYIVNLFSIIDGKMINISKKVKGFPTCFKQDNGYIYLKDIPSFLKKDEIFDSPDVFSGD